VGVGGGQHPSELEASGVHQLDDALALRMHEHGRVDQLADVRPRPACGYLAFRADSIYFKDLGEPSLNPMTIPACYWRMVDQGSSLRLVAANFAANRRRGTPNESGHLGPCTTGNLQEPDEPAPTCTG
jgi:hypothetical protein